MSKDGLGPILETCGKVGIDKVCLLAKFEDLEKIIKETDRVIPVPLVDIDKEQPSRIDMLAEKGMKGLKMIGPAKPYNDSSYFPFYEKALEYDLPILFHTGISGGGTYSVNMRPIYVDQISRTLPDLKVIMAHLGNPWYEEAAMSVRYNANMYFDLSGSSLKKKKPEFFRELLWWDKPGHPYKSGGDKHPFEKILFGTDVAPEWVEDVKNDYDNLFDGMDVPENYRKLIMGETAKNIYNI
jgi:predicted TIM-barrel fold metal-dependent hydrolase